jgi:hypothetical protein
MGHDGAMPAHTQPLPDPLVLLRRAVDRRAREGVSLERIEADVIAAAPVDEERRAVLWLYAWHRVGAGGRFWP